MNTIFIFVVSICLLYALNNKAMFVFFILPDTISRKALSLIIGKVVTFLQITNNFCLAIAISYRHYYIYASSW